MKSLEKHIIKSRTWTKSVLEESKADLHLSPEEEKEYNSLVDGSYEVWRDENITFFDKDRARQRINQKLFQDKKESQSRSVFRYWPSLVAASVIAILVSGVYFLYQDLISFSDNESIMPGQSIAYLEIDNMERIELGSLDTLLQFKKAAVKVNAEKLVYVASELKEVKNEYHKINVPRNGEYYLELSDGTKVWLNAESTLGFHSRFDGKQRIVDLTGEAYFEVVDNADQPFIVRTDKANVRVLGTHFNVKAYPDGYYTYATLNEGKVRVTTDSKFDDLISDEQLIINNQTGEYSKKKVDADIYTAWVKGQFVFKDEKLEDILHTISRWYDVQVFYTNQALKEERYSISLNRYENISNLLEHIELTESVQFEIKDKALIVR